ncbi:hypothetical protein NIES4071_60980 [Calothrix sp. NIES-4071]|nr:hypothetical protein NIES4071_60980 [Calothrix sp. NIES-4071]BAZ60405.1 hypothetical protein NIES4105_60930 [Calothrix sp. NIES-4105]
MGIEPQRSLDNKSEIGVERHEGAAAPDAGRRYSPRKSVSTPRVSSMKQATIDARLTRVFTAEAVMRRFI